MAHLTISLNRILSSLPPVDEALAERLIQHALAGFSPKIVVLDDDPTGVQTVHGVNVYTSWDAKALMDGFASDQSMFFVLTNSRGLTSEETEKLHREIAKAIVEASRQANKPFLLISRSDSTLRGHYPLETAVLRETLETASQPRFDGEIILPFFPEGGRYTHNNIHYVASGDQLVPAAQTEFAQDRSFPFQSSDLRDWVSEKHRGSIPAEAVRYISLDSLRKADINAILVELEAMQGFEKMIVNAMDYADVKVFVSALIAAIKKGKHYLFRTAAAFPKVIGGISDQALLTREELVNTSNRNGGLVIVGSHVNRTTRQLEYLHKADFIQFIEFNQHLALQDSLFLQEQNRVAALTDAAIRAGKTVAVYTKRERFDVGGQDKEQELLLAVKISVAISALVAKLKERPNFIIAKGGITSSDVGTLGLGVKKALVMGQILKGVPVWLTGPESRFPNLPYVIFPGNVGGDDDLYNAVLKMQP